jgi:hypothetical protein
MRHGSHEFQPHQAANGYSREIIVRLYDDWSNAMPGSSQGATQTEVEVKDRRPVLRVTADCNIWGVERIRSCRTREQEALSQCAAVEITLIVFVLTDAAV